jgi:hypothetical protein
MLVCLEENHPANWDFKVTCSLWIEQLGVELRLRMAPDRR